MVTFHLSVTYKQVYYACVFLFLGHKKDAGGEFLFRVQYKPQNGEEVETFEDLNLMQIRQSRKWYQIHYQRAQLARKQAEAKEKRIGKIAIEQNYAKTYNTNISRSKTSQENADASSDADEGVKATIMNVLGSSEKCISIFHASYHIPRKTFFSVVLYIFHVDKSVYYAVVCQIFARSCIYNQLPINYLNKINIIFE